MRGQRDDRMNEAERRARAVFRAGNKAVALAASAGLLAFLGFGIGTMPALGPALVPGHGAWRSAAHVTLPVRQTLSLAGLASPEPAGGDLRTVDASYGGLNSEVGPSWRLVVDWTRAGTVGAEGISPAGHSNDPASPSYSDLIGASHTGTFLPTPAAGAAATTSGAISSKLRP
jgi:acyl-homoserine lactone acylase PvdQ